MVMDDKLADII